MAGFINRGGKGSHRNYEHPRAGRITLSGQPGDDETQVYAELCRIVDEWIDAMKADGTSPPSPTAGRHLVERILDAA